MEIKLGILTATIWILMGTSSGFSPFIQRLTMDPGIDSSVDLISHDGDLILIWHTNRESPATAYYRDIYYAFLSHIQDQFPIAITHQSEWYPSGAIMENKLWMFYSVDLGKEIRYRYLDLKTREISPEYRLLNSVTNGSFQDFMPALLVDSHGEMILSWHADLIQGNFRIYFVKGNGSHWDEPWELAPIQGLEAAYAPDLIQDLNGVYWISYEAMLKGWNNPQIAIQFSKDLMEWSDPIFIPDPGDHLDEVPSLFQDSQGRYWLVWISDRAGYKDVWYSLSQDGMSWENPNQLTMDACIDFRPRLTQMDSDYLLIWESDCTGDFELWMMRFNPFPPKILDYSPKSTTQSMAALELITDQPSSCSWDRFALNYSQMKYRFQQKDSRNHTAQIQLNPGSNIIYVSCMNRYRVESKPAPISIEYTPPTEYITSTPSPRTYGAPLTQSIPTQSSMITPSPRPSPIPSPSPKPIHKPEPKIQMDAWISKSQLEPHEELIVHVNLTNLGLGPGNISLDLRLDGYPYYSRHYRLDPGKNLELDFFLRIAEPGIHLVELNNLSWKIRVIPAESPTPKPSGFELMLGMIASILVAGLSRRFSS